MANKKFDLKKWRISRGFVSQLELANKMGYKNRKAIASMEAGTHARMDMVILWCKEYDRKHGNNDL